MSTRSFVGPKPTFLVSAPDYTDEGAFERRMAVREAHLADAQKQHAAEVFTFGGAMLSPDGTKLVGSTIVVTAKDIETARAIIESDAYYKGNVWDKERITIVPFRSASW
ncbi:hypothetical protein AURDEDRAFT_64489 [Auricularia subglabra TFB-10046 SS5]|nr:hypothetical protein AURDEDRAFT_64489 [Auricularia subglabra TFB-10046 SS5]